MRIRERERHAGRRSVAAAVVVSLLAVGGVASAAPVPTIDEYVVPTEFSLPVGIAEGPDGNLWFTERSGSAVGRITPGGAITEFAVPADSGPDGIAAGPDGNLWVALRDAYAIAKVATGGAVTTYGLGATNWIPVDIAPGSDGAMWFTDAMGNRIGRITTSGVVTSYALGTGLYEPTAIAPGPDGAMWFTAQTGMAIGRIDTAGNVSEFDVGISPASFGDLVTGTDGAIWFTEQTTNSIGRLAADGSVSWFPLPTSNASPAGIALGADGNLWFAERDGDRIGRLRPGDGTIDEYPVPTAFGGPFGITAGPGGTVWFTEAFGDKIGRVTVPADGPPPATDTTAPTITIAAPTDGAVVVAGKGGPGVSAAMTASYACEDEDGGSGVASCDGTVENGGALDLTPGVHSLTVAATDHAGNSASLTHSYVVFKRWKGALALPPEWSTLKAGRRAWVHFNLGANHGNRVFAAGTPTSEPVDCSTGESLGPASPTLGRLAHLREHYLWRWDTLREWKGTCRAVTIELAVGEGASFSLFVSFPGSSTGAGVGGGNGGGGGGGGGGDDDDGDDD